MHSGVGGMSRANGRAATLLEAVVPGIVAWARRGVLRGAQAPPGPPPKTAVGKPLPAEVLAHFRLPAEAEEKLRAIDMPADDSPTFDGPKRRADTPEVAAAKLVIWARAINATGEYPSAVVCALYGECATADHRVAVADNRLLYALKHTPGVRCRRAPGPRAGYIWTIEVEPRPEVPEEAPASAPVAGPTPVAPQAAAHVDAPTLREESTRADPTAAAGGVATAPQAVAVPQRAVSTPAAKAATTALPPAVAARPLAKRAAEAPLPPRPIAKPPLNRPRLLHRFVGDQDEMWPQLVQARAREARRLGRARKQRGGRASRRAV
jgi:hypothetical protein